MKRMRNLLGIALAVAAISVFVLPAGASVQAGAAGGGGGVLTLVHGVPGVDGFPVDITVKGKFFGYENTFSGVTFGTVAPVDVPFDKYAVQVRIAGSDAASPPVLKIGTWVGIKDKAVVAHLDAGGAPMISKFNDTTWLIRDGNAKVTVRHLAAAPAVDIIANDALTVIDALTNPNQGMVRVPAGEYNIKVAADADNDVVVFDADLTFASGTNTIVYAIGDLSADPSTFTVIPVVKNVKYVWGGTR